MLADADDDGTFGRTFTQISTTKEHFGVIIAVPIQTDSGRCVGVMTMNLDSAVKEAMFKANQANVSEILKAACADAGNLVLG